MVLNNFIRLFIIFFLAAGTFFCKDKKVNTENLIQKDNKNTEKQEPKPKEIQEPSSTSQEKWEPKYNSYINPRFGYSVKYPSCLDKKSESENGDGSEFNSSDGFKMTVFGSYDVSVLNQNIDKLYQDEIKNHKDVTYKVKKNNWFVISGYDGEYIFYIKKYVGSNTANTLYLNYPSNLRDKYYNVITVISKSFKEGNLNSKN